MGTFGRGGGRIADFLFNPIKELGCGGEGTVYLVEALPDRERWVLKVFHSPIQTPEPLRRYASMRIPEELGLLPLHLLEEAGAIVAVRYPFVSLFSVPVRLMLASEHVTQVLFGAYCRMQAHLMARVGLGLVDTVVDNFLLSRDGRFYFVDFGWGIRSVHHPRMREQGKWEYGFVMMLLSLYNRNLKLEMLPHAGYADQSPGAYSRSRQLEQLAAERPWVGEIVEQLLRSPTSIFLDPGFYQRIGQRFPNQIRFPGLVYSLTMVQRFRNRFYQLTP